MGKTKRVRFTNQRVVIGHNHGHSDATQSHAASAGQDGSDTVNLDLYMHVTAEKMVGVGVKWTLSLRLESLHGVGGVLDEDLDIFFDTAATNNNPPTWITYVHGIETRPVHTVCSAVWLLQYARATVTSPALFRIPVFRATSLVPWWRIIRYTNYILNVYGPVQRPTCATCRSRYERNGNTRSGTIQDNENVSMEHITEGFKKMRIF
ncbi:hypothetical protein LXA43DRAFT_1066514 [Ganoderma leucocontextum]|nr:hypothetical protein LXA43DRAFT_1066514 [Ganoderma leucocontextum]